MIAIFNDVRPLNASNHTRISESRRKRPGGAAPLVSPRGESLHRSPRPLLLLRQASRLELVVQASGKPEDVTAAPRGQTGAAVIDESIRRAVVTIRGEA